MQYTGIILAAGSGSRISNKFNQPKCLIKINQKTILDYQIESFIFAGIKEVIIVTGYKSEKIKDHVKKFRSKIKIKLILNSQYSTTNNMYSAHLAIKEIGPTSVVLCNGDVVVEKPMVKKLLSNKHKDLVMVDRNKHDEESMKIKLNNNRIIDIDKKFINSKLNLTSTDFYKFSPETFLIFKNQIKHHIKKIGKNDWTEIALKKIFKKTNFLPCNIEKIKWFEIDNYKDYLSANFLFKNHKEKILKKYKTFIIDIDGTTFKKSTPLQGTENFINKLKNKGKSIFFLSNNSSMNFESFQKLFKKVNYKLKKTSMIISTNILIKYLKKNKIKKVFVVGNHNLKKELKKNKFDLSSNNPSYVVIGYDDQLNYKKLQEACEYINRGIGILATHDDNFYPSLKGPIPDAGSILHLIYKTTNVKPDKIFGKPSKEIKDIYKFKSKVLVIGDRISKDIQFAKNCKYDSILVLSGAEESFKKDDELRKLVPNYIITSLNDLV
jgi:HAD superfamily hydrolase (TIGR01450 family)